MLDIGQTGDLVLLGWDMDHAKYVPVEWLSVTVVLGPDSDGYQYVVVDEDGRFHLIQEEDLVPNE